MTSMTFELTKANLGVRVDEHNVTEGVLLMMTQEIAMEITPIPEIIASYGMTLPQFEKLAQRPRFQELMREQTIKWASAKSASERIKAKTEAMIEHALPNLFKEILKDGLSTSKVELVKAMMKMGGVGGPEVGIAGGDKVTIQINLSPGPEPKAMAGQVIDHNAEDM